MMIGRSMEELRLIKTYRTPQALRNFGRVLSLFLPPFYAPYYVEVARDTGSLGLGIGLAVVVSMTLTGLFESIQVLEDPFVASTILEGIGTFMN